MSVNPKVIETPIISAVAKNGIELRVRAHVTVRANIDRLVGGAGEATIIARVGEGIVTTVGSSERAHRCTQKIRITSLVLYWVKVLMRVLHSKSCPSILLT